LRSEFIGSKHKPQIKELSIKSVNNKSLIGKKQKI
jgi:hypothetical protein